MWNKARIEKILWKGYYNLKIRAWMTVAFAASWWGILYPELCFTEATCQAVVIEECAVAEDQQDDMCKKKTQQEDLRQPTYREMLETTGDEVVVKSRFLEWMGQYIDQ